MNFLQHAARQIWRQYHNEINTHLFLFPSRRSMLYFKRELSEAAGKPIWVPDCLTMDQWILDLSNGIPSDSITSAFLLYQAAREVGFVDYNFEIFYPLAQIILADFEDADMALANPTELWAHTSAWQNTPEHPHAMVWNVMKDTPLKRRWEVNWNALGKLYESFGKLLKKEGISTKGLIYREVLSDLEQESSFNYPRIHVLGFSSLREVEVQFFLYLQSRHPVSFYWNLIPAFDAPGLDAGLGVAPWVDLFGQDLDDYKPATPEVEMISVPGMIGQIKVVSQIIENSGVPEDKIAVVLPHPSLIDLLVGAFPNNVEKVNISLGFPLVYSPVRTLVEWIVDMWDFREQNDHRIKTTDVERVCTHVYLRSYFESNEIPFPDPTSQLYFNPEQIKDKEPIGALLFDPLRDINQALERLVRIIQSIVSYQSELFHKEVLRYVKGRLTRLQDVLMGINEMSLVFLKRILNEMMMESSIPFRGEPMQGIQILGLQEVQNLEFDTLIIPGMNEEIVPAGKIKSMIPYSLRQYYKLENLSARHSAQSYYLWSAMMQARKVYVLFSQGKDYLGSKGMSRYIYQLKYGGAEVQINEKHLELDLAGFEFIPKKLFLRDGYEDRLRTYFQAEGLSATALTSYLTCPFQFFLRYILRIREVDIAVAGLDSRQMGSAIHEVMYELYKPWVGKSLEQKNFDQIRDGVESATRAVYAKLYPNDTDSTLNSSLHWVEQTVIQRAVHRIIERDRQIRDLMLVNLEQDYERTLDTPCISKIRLRGKIDRIDRIGNVLRIIDYKTGVSDLNKSSWQNNWSQRNPKHNWQLFFYAYLMKDTLGSGLFQVGHYTLRDRNIYTPLEINKEAIYTNNDLLEFEQVLLEIIEEITHPDIPFSQTENKQACKYCVFNTYCERQSN